MSEEFTHYKIDKNICTGCTLCAQNCPVNVISGESGKPHEIDQEGCIRCGSCYDVCPYGAVIRS